MKLDLTINGRERRIEIADGRFQIGDAPPREVSVETVQPGVYSILLEGRSYRRRLSL
jgi:hypothetical protein